MYSEASNPNNYKWRRRIFRVLALVFVVIYAFYALSVIYQLFNYSVLPVVFSSIYLFAELILSFYFILLLWHLVKSYTPVTHPRSPVLTTEPMRGDTTVPFVSVIIPIYDEPVSVVKNTINSALQLNYPKDRFDVAIVEDQKKSPAIEEYCKSNQVSYYFREERDGFKAGAINYVLQRVKGQYVLLLDSDHIIAPGIVTDCLMNWREDTIAVQTRIEFVNRINFFTKLSSYLHFHFFSLYQRARRPTGSAIFAGGGAVFDRHKLLEEGGFNPLTIADDTDTSIILRSKGHRIEYIDQVGVYALVPWHPFDQIRQLWRWNTGITRSFRARWKAVINSDSPLHVKLDHLTVGLIPTLTILLWFNPFLLLIMNILGLSFIHSPLLSSIFWVGFTFFILPSMPLLSFIYLLFTDTTSALTQGTSVVRETILTASYFLLLFALQPFLIGAIVKGWFDVEVVFNRTPKNKSESMKEFDRAIRPYFLPSLALVILGTALVSSIVIFDVLGVGFVPLIGAISCFLPIIVILYWSKKIDAYMSQFQSKSALDYVGSIIGD